MAAVAEAAPNRQQQQQGRPGGPVPLGRPGAPPSRPRFQPVDREKTCPLLLRVFTKINFRVLFSLSHLELYVPDETGREDQDDGKKFCVPRILEVELQPISRSLLRKVGGHHAKEEFAIRGKEPKDEVQIYTWKDATLRELTDLVKEVAAAARKRDAKLSFSFVYPDKQGRYVVRPVGMTYSYPGNGRRQDDMKTLAELGFQIGDYLDVAIS